MGSTDATAALPPADQQVDEQQLQAPYHGTPPIQHNIALAAAVVGSVGLLLPGGKRGFFTLQNMVLGGGVFMGLNQLAYDYTGRSVTQRSADRWGRLLQPLDELPERARANKALMEAERARRTAALPEEKRQAAEAELQRRLEARENAKRGFFQRLWMGNEQEGWQERRQEEDRKALESGKGIGDIIMDQISQVWNQGKGKD
ncbi:hypothetical protein VTK73DRAFT_1612 [Phialemonium thermophilum]|uniref:Rhomboid family membrane protein n=1 Tax=Phialemonium thermophilum TaxID=223376 RepID=A0ABR3Y332_9PEZI